MAVYGVIESTNMASTKRGGVRIFDAVATKDIENGTVGHLEGLAAEGGVIYKFVEGAKAGYTTVIVDTPAWDPDTSKTSNQRKDKFINPAGVAFRARTLVVNDEFAVTKACFTAATQEKLKDGAGVKVDTTGKLVAGDAAEGDFGVILRHRTQGGQVVTAAHTYGYPQVFYTVKVNTLA